VSEKLGTEAERERKRKGGRERRWTWISTISFEDITSKT
jgi:hypothetical protein